MTVILEELAGEAGQDEVILFICYFFGLNDFNSIFLNYKKNHCLLYADARYCRPIMTDGTVNKSFIENNEDSKNIPKNTCKNKFENTPENTTDPRTEENFDDVFVTIGQIGWYQIIWILCVLLALFGEGISLISPVFEEATPYFHCNVTDASLLPTTTDSCGKEIIESCYEYETEGQPESLPVPCTNGYYYNYTNGKTTTATEFNLVCDREVYNTITGTMWYIGQTIGSISFGAIADNYGRKPAILSGTVGYIFFGSIAAFCPNWWSFAISKSLSGVFMRWGSLAGIMYASEIIGVKYRAIVQCFWYVSYSTLIGSLSLYGGFQDQVFAFFTMGVWKSPKNITLFVKFFIKNNYNNYKNNYNPNLTILRHFHTCSKSPKNFTKLKTSS